jgi:hypothetical protein
MDQRTRSGVAGGVLLILLGIFFLIYQLMPGRLSWLSVDLGWPFIIVGVGLFLLILGLIVGAPGMAIPASILSGIGLLLYWQNATGNWESWAYAWTLIPGFVGVGVILNGLLGGDRLRSAFESGFWLILISLTLFAIFSAVFQGPNLFGPYMPVLLIVFGVLLLVRGFFRRR